MMKKVVTTLLVVATLTVGTLGTTSTEASASCSGYTVNKNIGSWYCEANDGCGFLWTKGTKTIKTQFVRYCNKSGKQVAEYKIGPTKNGCCV